MRAVADMLSTREVADYLGIHEKQVYPLLRQGRLPGTRVTGRWVFSRRLVAEWIEACSREAVKPRASAPTVRGVAKPVISVVQGVCVGGGNELNVACDLALASENARFAQAGPRVGSVPAFGIPQDFHLTVGEKKAKEVVFLCRLYPAAEAKAMGWINEVVAPDQLDRVADEWAAELIEKSPTALALAKRMHNAWHNLASQVAEDAIEQLARFWGTPEALEGFTAFREKRTPDFGRFAR